jgi:hypothetical protein
MQTGIPPKNLLLDIEEQISLRVRLAVLRSQFAVHSIPLLQPRPGFPPPDKSGAIVLVI